MEVAYNQIPNLQHCPQSFQTHLKSQRSLKLTLTFIPKVINACHFFDQIFFKIKISNVLVSKALDLQFVKVRGHYLCMQLVAEPWGWRLTKCQRWLLSSLTMVPQKALLLMDGPPGQRALTGANCSFSLILVLPLPWCSQCNSSVKKSQNNSTFYLGGFTMV